MDRGRQSWASRVGRWAARALCALALAVAAVVGASALALAATTAPPRGQMVDVGEGRRLRLVCEGPAASDRPVVWFESGAFGIASDWAAVQAMLAAEAVRSCAYDRAGLGFSDPGPRPRAALAVARDLDRLIAASGETGPFVFVAHSAGGLYLRAFTGLRPEWVRGIVLVDAMTPEAVRARAASGFLLGFRRGARWVAAAASLGLMKPVALTSVADRIGLPPAARAEKRRAMGRGRHNRAAAAEVAAWPQAIEEAAAQPSFDPAWPVALVTQVRGPSSYNALREAPARAARRGRVEAVAGATHTSLLGERYGARIADAVRFVSE
jgi:pimeloyl-ACP methyl ester carboxylesterase